MENYYQILGLEQSASDEQIKRAFRERAKKVHPDIAGEAGKHEMQKLLTAYETLLNQERRAEYDRAYTRFTKHYDFDYRAFLKERKDDPESQAKLIFFDLLHLEEEEALEVWHGLGGLDFPLDAYLDREDWMDCSFILAEELDKRGLYYEAFMLLIDIIREERRKPYFRHFMDEVDIFLKNLVRTKLNHAVDDELLVECMEELIDLGYSRKDEARWLRIMAEALVRLDLLAEARTALQGALERDPELPNVVLLKRRLGLAAK
ncbi:J domain-containing protein [Gracilinema caldarium]|uniref:Heat shock protein DnaJ domain protein n=1 Tax=Gracilinema caldarium (strain ATCC 51460 / DSM 7334 / H1) TaxID=744872 RepID=F8F3K5_GRAC1|nr:DnaJ domain-containing protein [Gracilinema caldarium]AEJ19949.1 heat shock protein DnaJ domain protein [Gracilinema caldarium DSM 7334]